MSQWIKRLQALLARVTPRHTYDDQALDRAADLYDVERRLNLLDLRGRAFSPGYDTSQSFR